ncbi:MULTISPECIES: carbohydrate ABC transporter permease [unclassified Paenibacillus]|uniref:carbohydrate ABC transporter permease n=1 Tax=unclassified Paenibacillus TaxID=185978 RepID=UPI001042E4F4|nr:MULTISPECIES: carbohydrate ABC transporter permease [unclassified Paenibacillus]NIK71225.1 putative aldouronate transport system permease protein [Paenibacillus sp. BK720]TCM97055.1 putative aldouronate transport system permease protein [Paenibacillus sp. BK033]
MFVRRSTGDVIFSACNYILLLLLGIGTLFPFLNLAAISLNDAGDTLKGTIYVWPRVFTLENYGTIFANDGLAAAAVRSVIRTLVGTVLGVLCTAMLAYALSRKEFFLRKPFNVILIITMYVNGGLIPFYLLVKNIGLMNHAAVYILPMLIGVFNVIIMRSYFEQLPEGIVESARIDGASDFQILFRIVLQISLPVLSTITLYIAVQHWNSWFDNYLYASRNENLNLLQYELQKILISSVNQVMSANTHIDATDARRTNPETIRAAMTIIVTLPILLVYPFLQKYFVKGMTFAAMKE